MPLLKPLKKETARQTMAARLPSPTNTQNRMLARLQLRMPLAPPTILRWARNTCVDVYALLSLSSSSLSLLSLLLLLLLLLLAGWGRRFVGVGSQCLVLMGRGALRFVVVRLVASLCVAGAPLCVVVW